MEGRQPEKSFFEIFVRLEPSGTQSPRRREDGPVVYPGNAFDSRLRGD